MKKNFFVLFATLALCFSSVVAGTLFDTDFSDLSGWQTDRYAPAKFEQAVFDGEKRLHMQINEDSDERTSGKSGTFYNTHGKKTSIELAITGEKAVTVSASLYIDDSWETDHRRSDLWAVTKNASGDITAYPIIGFGNTESDNPTFRVWASDDKWHNLSTAIDYDEWYHLAIVCYPTENKFYINGELVYTDDLSSLSITQASVDEIIIQGYNFGDPNLASEQQDFDDEYDIYWDDLAVFASENLVWNTTQNTVHGTIQAAIDDADSGDEIEVSAGEYDEFLEIDKSLTILGPNDEVNPNTGTRATEAVLKPSGTSKAPIIKSTSADIDVAIKGFTFDLQDTPADEVNYNVSRFVEINGKKGNDWTFANNIFQNANSVSCGNWYITGNCGDFYLDLTNNLFRDNACSNGIAVWATGTNYIDMTGNVFKNNEAWAVNLNRTQGTFENNKCISTDGNGGEWWQHQGGFLLAASNNDITIKNNEFTDLFGHGIYVSYNFEGDLDITGNDFTGIELSGVKMKDADISGVTVSDNTFDGNETHIANATDETAQCTCNYFGTTNPDDIEAKISGDVEWIPFRRSENGECEGVRVTFNDSEGNLITSGMTMKMYDGGWSTLAFDGDDIFFPSSSNPKFRLYYGVGMQEITYGGNNIEFQTTAVTPALKDSDGNEIAGGTVKSENQGWSGPADANTAKEMLPGTYKFRMYYKNGLQEKRSVAVSGAAQEVLFTTVTVTPALKDSDGNEITGGTVKSENQGWSGPADANTAKEMLPGTYKFRMYYKNGLQEKSSVAVSGAAQEVLFTTVTVTPALKDSDGNEIAGGTVKSENQGWSGPADANIAKEMLPGTYKFRMYYKNGLQEKRSVAVSGAAQEVLFTTVTVTPALKDSDGNEIAGGTVKSENQGWSGPADANIAKEMLPGTYKFRMYYKNGLQEKRSVAVSGTDQEVLFTTVTVTPALKDSDGNEIAGGTVKSENQGWSGAKDANTAIEMLPGTYKFRMYYKNGLQEKRSVAVSGAAQEVLFTTVTVTAGLWNGTSFIDGGATVKTENDGWSGPSASGASTEMLPGTYKFRLTTANGTVDNKNGVTVPNNDDDGALAVMWGAGTLDFNYGSTVHYRKDNTGSWILHEDDDLEYLLCGTYRFKFVEGQYEYQKDIVIECGDNYIGDVFIFRTMNENGEALPNVPISWNHRYSSYKGIGSTDADGILFTYGVVTEGGNQKFKADYNYTAQTKTTPGYAEFQTCKATAKVVDHNSDPVEGAKVSFNHRYSSYMTVGTTGSDGTASIELFPGSRKFKAELSYTSQAKTITLKKGDAVDVEFQTMLAKAKVVDHNADPVEGAKVSFNHRYSSYMTVGTTGSDGTASIKLFPGSRKFKAELNYTSQAKTFTLDAPASGVSEDDDIDQTFSTALAKILVKDCESDNPVEGAKVSFNHRYSSYMTVGTTGSDGTASIKLFPGSRKFKAEINYTSKAETIQLQASSNEDDPDLTFTPACVNIEYAGTVKWNHRYSSYTGVTEDYYMFPGTYKFKFDDKIENLTIDGCSYGGSMVYVELLDETNNPVNDPNGDFTTKVYSGGWSTLSGHPGDNGDGLFLATLPENASGRVKFKMEGPHGTDEQWVDISTVSKVTFYTGCKVTFFNSIGEPIEGALVKIYGNGGWKELGTTDANGEVEKDLLYDRYKFKIYYKGATQDKWHTINENEATHTIAFNTESVTVTLKKDNDRGAITDADNESVKYYASGWKNFGEEGSDYTLNADGTAAMELLPVKYKFRVYYKGARKETWHNVAKEGASIEFLTQKVKVEINNSEDKDITDADNESVKYYASGWKSFADGTLDANGEAETELLPVKYKFRVYYKGARKETWHNVAKEGGLITFATHKVTVKSQNSAGTGINGGEVDYYASGWKTFGDGVTGDTPAGEESVELLPVNYKFRMEYKGQRNERWHNVAKEGDEVVFEFVNPVVTVKLLASDGSGLKGGDVTYYASGWKTFGTTDDNGEAQLENLLEGKYKFRMTYLGGRKEFWHTIKKDDPATHTITFRTEKAAVEATNLLGDLSGEKVKYYASGWKTFASDMTYNSADGKCIAYKELLPAKYKFRIEFEGMRNEKWETISSNDATVTFPTINPTLTVKLLASDGTTGLSGGTAKMYASGWKTIGTTGANGETQKINVLPGKYKFRMEYAGGRKEMYQTIVYGDDDTHTVTFNTVNTTVKLENCEDGGIAGGTVQYYASGWKTVGTTDSDGLTSIDLLPLKYKFRMNYNGQRKAFYQNVAGDANVIFPITKVVLKNNCNIKYYTSGWKSYSAPCDYILPGRYKFKFDNVSKYLDIAGCTYKKAAAVVEFNNSRGRAISGASVSYRYGWGSYSAMPNTNSAGKSIYMVDNDETRVKFRVTYKGASVEKERNILSTGIIGFNTVKVISDLYDSKNNDLTASKWKYRYGYGNYSTFDNDGEELLPVKVKIRCEYKGASVEKEQDAGNNPSFTFKTKPVTAELQDSDSNPLTASKWHYRYGYGNYNLLDNGGEELLPVKVKVRCEYKGTSVEKEQSISSNAHYIFSTVEVSAELKDSQNNDLTASSWHYRYGYGNYSSLDKDGEELLPVKVKVRTGYKGATIEKEQNISTKAHYTFKTVNVTADLKDNNGTDLTADSWQYRYGYGNYSSLDNDGEELLPVKTKVKASYSGTSKEKEQNLASKTHYDFTWDGNGLYKKSNMTGGWDGLTSSARPNPFTEEVSVDFTVSQDAPVTIEVYNTEGELVRMLHNGELSSGEHSVSWDGTDAGGIAVPSGIYFCIIRSGEYKEMLKLNLIK